MDSLEARHPVVLLQFLDQLQVMVVVVLTGEKILVQLVTLAMVVLVAVVMLVVLVM